MMKLSQHMRGSKFSELVSKSKEEEAAIRREAMINGKCCLKECGGNST